MELCCTDKPGSEGTVEDVLFKTKEIYCCLRHMDYKQMNIIKVSNIKREGAMMGEILNVLPLLLTV